MSKKKKKTYPILKMVAWLEAGRRWVKKESLFLLAAKRKTYFTLNHPNLTHMGPK
jgi:hypothetical protein